MTIQESEAEAGQPLKERLLPQTSIRFFVLLIGASALVMYTFRAALVGDALWAKCASLAIMTVIGCFISYAVLFLIAMPFASAAAAISELPHHPAASSGGGGLIEGGASSFTTEDADAFEIGSRAANRSPDSTENQ